MTDSRSRNWLSQTLNLSFCCNYCALSTRPKFSANLVIFRKQLGNALTEQYIPMLLAFGRNLYIYALCNWQRISKVWRAIRKCKCHIKIMISLKRQPSSLFIKGPKNNSYPPSTDIPCTKVSTPWSVLSLKQLIFSSMLFPQCRKLTITFSLCLHENSATTPRF